MPRQHPDWRPARGDRLGRLLARWADAHRLDERRAEAMGRAIVAGPTARGFDWWWSLLDPVSGSAFRAARSRAASRWPTDAPDLPTPAIALGIEAWHQGDADRLPDYQPYLRLT